MFKKIRLFMLFSFLIPLPFILNLCWDLLYILPNDYKNYSICYPDSNVSVSNRCFIWGIPRRKFDFDRTSKMKQILEDKGDYSKDYDIPSQIFAFNCDTIGYVKEYTKDSVFVRVMGKYKLTHNTYNFDGYVLRSQIRINKIQ